MHKLRIKPSMILAFVYLLVAIPVTVIAKNIDAEPTYGLTLNVTYAANTTQTEPNPKDNKFYIMSSNTNYVILDYLETDRAYHFETTTKNDNLASKINCGKNPENPNSLVISGLPAGTYKLVHSETNKNYQKITEPVTIVFSENEITVDDIVIKPDENNNIFLDIILTQSPNLPTPNKWQPVIDFVKNTAYVTLFALLIFAPVITYVLCHKTHKTKRRKK